MGRSAWELKFGTERGLLGVLGRLWGASWVSWGASLGALGGSWGFLEDLLLSWLRFGGSWWASWGLKGAKIKSFGNSGCQLEPVLAPKEPPRGGPNPPKRAQEAPESTLKSIFKSQISIYQKCGFSVVKCNFLRVGGPAWELKIDAERLQETEKNEEEEESEKRREKSAYIWPEKGPPKTFLS